jgi:hypothetical protein
MPRPVPPIPDFCRAKQLAAASQASWATPVEGTYSILAAFIACPVVKRSDEPTDNDTRHGGAHAGDDPERAGLRDHQQVTRWAWTIAKRGATSKEDAES